MLIANKAGEPWPFLRSRVSDSTSKGSDLYLTQESASCQATIAAPLRILSHGSHA